MCHGIVNNGTQHTVAVPVYASHIVGSIQYTYVVCIPTLQQTGAALHADHSFKTAQKTLHGHRQSLHPYVSSSQQHVAVCTLTTSKQWSAVTHVQYTAHLFKHTVTNHCATDTKARKMPLIHMQCGCTDKPKRNHITATWTSCSNRSTQQQRVAPAYNCLTFSMYP